jgi:hypothetical protein
MFISVDLKPKNMKKTVFAIFTLFAFSICMTSCKKDKPQPEPTPEPTVNSYDFDAVIKSDYRMIENLYDDFMFYEAHALFSKNVNTLTSPEIISMRTIFQVEDTVLLLDHLENDFSETPEMTKIIDHMIGDIQIFVDQIPVSFAQAWDYLRTSDIPMPTGNTMTLRTPLSPPFDEYPSYIFPTTNGQYIRVYSGDGTVEFFQ